MAASKEPSFASVPKAGQAQIATANAGRDGTGTVGTVWTAGAEGSKIEQVTVQATGTTTTGMIRFFLHDGSVFRMFDEVPVTAVTPSATVTAYFAERTYENLVIPAGWSLRASTEKAETFNVIAQGGDF